MTVREAQDWFLKAKKHHEREVFEESLRSWHDRWVRIIELYNDEMSDYEKRFSYYLLEQGYAQNSLTGDIKDKELNEYLYTIRTVFD